jgi:ankyrin repeat protein
MIGVNNGTALHRATAGDLAMLKRLVAKGADVSDRNNPFNATPLAWADHDKQTESFPWMQEHCAIDLHDAVSFNLRDHVEARLREDPASVNKCIDHWKMPQSTPLHWAAAQNREELAKLLLEKGADPNILAGNGLTALDVAEQARAEGIVKLIEQRGGKRAADM